jgi:hypothetical protein
MPFMVVKTVEGSDSASYVDMLKKMGSAPGAVISVD